MAELEQGLVESTLDKALLKDLIKRLFGGSTSKKEIENR